MRKSLLTNPRPSGNPYSNNQSLKRLKTSSFLLYKPCCNLMSLSFISVFEFRSSQSVNCSYMHNKHLLKYYSLICWFKFCYFWIFDSFWHQKWDPKTLNNSEVSEQKVLVPTGPTELTALCQTRSLRVESLLDLSSALFAF